MKKSSLRRRGSLNASKKTSNLWQEWVLGWIPLSAVSGIILRAAIWKPQEIPHFLFRFSDKVLHGLEFLILAMTAYQAFRTTSWKWIHEKRFFAVPIYSSVIAFLSEWVQRGVPGRSFEVLDLGADAAGITLALGLIFTAYRLQEKV